ncbi:MAG: GAF domain-containing protein [Anaerolineaceae bacterium]|jgi:GAF domain-containing protein|nr:MAG: GAF domain-containing protein [Anaerolineaceae bacterium]
MLQKIFGYFIDEEDTDPSFIALTRNILIFVMVTTLAVLPLVAGVTGEEARSIVAIVVLSAALIAEGAALFFVFQGNVLPAKIIVPVVLVIAITTIAININGLRDTSILALPLILVISALLLGRRSLTLTTPLVVIAVLFIALRDLSTGRDPSPIGINDAIIVVFLLIAGAGIIHLLVSRLNESIIRAQLSEQEQKIKNEELDNLRAGLEERVRERTAELEKANLVSEKRARQFEAVAQVLKAISSIQDLEILLSRITQVISEQFGIYHTGIFLLNNQKEYAVLRAANSEGGKKMLAREHKLEVGQTGLVGFVTATGQPRIALDVGVDAVFFDNPDLPDTRSEVALPLRFAGQVIGALDVQSTEPNAFRQDDINVLITLADQVSVAINNALSIEETRKSLAEAQSAIGRTTREAWQVMRPTSTGLGFLLTETSIKPLDKPLDGSHIHEALEKGKPVIAGNAAQGTNLAIPIRLRGQPVGVLNVSARKGIYALTDDDIDIAEAVAERLSLALETAALLQATQHRAEIERVTTEITSNISSSTRFETILKTAAHELSRALGGSDVLVQIEPVSMKMIMDA